MSLDSARINHASDSLHFGICNIQNPRVTPIMLRSSKQVNVHKYKLIHQVNHATREHLNAGRTFQTLPNGVKGDIGVICVLDALEKLGFRKVAVNPVDGQGYDIHAFRGKTELRIEVKNLKHFKASTDWVKSHISDRFVNDGTANCNVSRVLITSWFDPHDPQAARKLLKQRSIELVEIGKQMLNPGDALNSSDIVVSKLKDLIPSLNP